MASGRTKSEDGDEDFPGICREVKRRKLENTSSQRCIICLEVKGESVRKGKALATFISALKRRKDDVYKRLSGEMENLKKADVFWHSSCYSTYTSEQNIRYAAVTDYQIEISIEEDDEAQERASRSRCSLIDWSKCLFCRNKTHKKIKTMYNVATFEACETIRRAAEAKKDEGILRYLLSVNNDLIAAEAKYHKTCFSSYVSKRNLHYQGLGDNESTYEAAFKELVASIEPGIRDQGRAYDLSSILQMYQELLKEKGVDGERYTKHRLKERLKKFFGDEIDFFQARKRKSEIIFPSSLSIQDLINNTAEASKGKSDPASRHYQQFCEVASRIRDDIKKTDGISLRPLDVKEVSLETAKRIVPSSLYLLLQQMISPSQLDESGNIPSCRRIEDERKVLTIAQDVIHCVSSARVKLPKQIGLAMAIHHLTGSKMIITLLNRMGHCSSYSEVQAVDTSLAMEVAAMAEQFGTVVPSNISPGPFVQLAADNTDINEETLDDKNTTHATSMVVYQRRQFGPALPPTPRADHSKRRRSLDAVGTLYKIQECSVHGRKPPIHNLNGIIQGDWFANASKELSAASNRDAIWAMLRIDPSHLLDVTVVNAATRQIVPSWSAFNAILFPDIPCITNVGYCPLLDASSTEFSTVYTVMKHAQKISQSVGQSETVITFDLAIYVKAKQIQLKHPVEFSDTILHLGGFHVAFNFMSVIGKKYQSSGLEDLLIESGVYAAGTTTALISGRTSSYNRGVRAHKLCFEASCGKPLLHGTAKRQKQETALWMNQCRINSEHAEKRLVQKPVPDPQTILKASKKI